MEKENALKRVLVVDDVELNRFILKGILCADFDVVEAEGGTSALEILKRENSDISIVLLDIVMPDMDGFEVLSAMKKLGYLNYIPVIIISTESTAQYVDKAYEMGATDFINKPYNPNVVLHRVLNTIKLFNRQQTLMEIVTEQVYEKHRYADMMVNILSTVMELKNGESGLHLLHINTITRILTENLLQMTDKYTFSRSDIQLICVASSLHDIGKMAIPDEIINKPGKLSPEEFEIMKTHSAQGAKMIQGLTEYKDERLVHFAYDICLYHHERYDGGGYPVGLKGEEIPIWAQIVSVADVFDALMSERVYKPAYSPEKALQMIIDGECGTFNPILIECLIMCSKQIVAALTNVTAAEKWEEKARYVANDVEKYHINTFSSKSQEISNLNNAKLRFLTSNSDGMVFDYSFADGEMVISANPDLGIAENVVLNPLDREQASKYFYLPVLDKALEYLNTLNPAEPEVSFEYKMADGDKLTLYKINMLAVYDDSRTNCLNVIGKITKTEREISL
ncbi:MAG: response regulator [Clostridia bacterium]|nr:response regulator [Clostridia bacterium]